MKNFRWIMIVFVSIFFIAGVSSLAWAACPLLSITSPSTLPQGTKNQAYSNQIQKSGGQAPVTFSKVSGSLPPGLNLSSTGVISGTPTSVSSYNFTVKVTDSCHGVSEGKQTAQKAFSLLIKTKNYKQPKYAPAVDIGPPKYKQPKLKDKPILRDKSFIERERIIAIPKIESAIVVPLGALKPGTKLYLKGKDFGAQPGKILMYGNFPNNPVELLNVNWVSSTKVNGVVPMSTNGAPNQTVTIKVKTAYNKLSNPWNIDFVGREEKVLSSSAATFNCGTDGNYNVCNQWKSGSISFFMSSDCPSNIAVCGAHANEYLASGKDTGKDIFQISLKNGWKFKSMQKVKWHKSSGNETLSGPNPSVPVGQSNWNPSISWVVSQNDYVHYKIKVIVEGPLGTSYK